MDGTEEPTDKFIHSPGPSSRRSAPVAGAEGGVGAIGDPQHSRSAVGESAERTGNENSSRDPASSRSVLSTRAEGDVGAVIQGTLDPIENNFGLTETRESSRSPSPRRSVTASGTEGGDVVVEKPAFVLQWNICGIHTRFPGMQLAVKAYNPSIIAIQELRSKKVDKLDRLEQGRYVWRSVQPTSGTHSNGVALGVDRNIPHKFIDVNTDLQVVAAVVDWPFKATYISVYVSRLDDIKTLAERLKTVVSNVPAPVVLLGDFNAHSDLWGGSSIDNRGRAVEELLVSSNMIFLNDGSPTRICPKDGHFSAIDLSITSESIASRFTWDVGDDCHGSDHFPLLLRITDKPIEVSKRPRWLYEKADWKRFQEVTIAPERIEVESVTAAIINAAKKSIPLTSCKIGTKSVHWWSTEVAEAVKIRRKHLRRLRKMDQNNPNRPAALADFQSARRKAREIIKEAKQKSWSNFVTGISPSLSTTEVWRRINCFRTGKKETIDRLLINGELVIEPKTVAERLADYFYEVSADSSMTTEHLEHRHTVTVKDPAFKNNEDEYYNEPFRLDELTFALKSCKGQSAGPDRVGYPMLQNLSPDLIRTVLELFNKIWICGHIPTSWKEGIVVPIPKTGKDCKELGNQRPITLVSCLGKLLEKMVNRRLLTLLESLGVLGEEQFGFRTGRGTDDYFADFEEEVQQVFDNRKHMDCVLLDITKAYDTAWRTPILASLERWGIGGRLARYVQDFLSERTFRVSIGNVLSELRIQENGVPQGTVLAVTAFLIRMTELRKYIPTPTRIRLYADDIMLTTVSKFPIANRKRTQNAVAAVETWTSLHGFQLAGSKSNVLHITRRHRTPELPAITTDTGPILAVQSARILGVTIDRRFNFLQHAYNTKNSTEGMNRLLNLIGGHLTSGSRSTLIQVHRATIQAKIFHGVGLTSRASEAVKRKIEPVYTAGIRRASGAFRSSPITSLLVEAGQLPFNYVETERLVGIATRIQSKDKNVQGEVLALQRAREQFENITQERIPAVEKVTRIGFRVWSTKALEIDWEMSAHVRAGDPSSKVLAAFRTVIGKYSDHRKIYTDGSVDNEMVGCGVVDGINNRYFRLPAYCSIFSAEAFAIMNALKSLEAGGPPVVVFSDSASVLSAIEGGKSCHPWVQAIELEMERVTATLCWIPGHSNIRGNEEADRLAGLARELEIHLTAIPASDIVRWAREKLRLAWEISWFKERNLQFRQIKPNTLPGIDRENQAEQRTLTRLRIGHTRLTHAGMFSGQFNECDTCGVRKTVPHILLECRALEGHRIAAGLPNNLYDILNNNPEAESRLLKFIRLAELFNEI